MILEKMYEIAVELRIQPSTIKGRSPLSLTMSIPQQMMSYPRVVPHIWVYHRGSIKTKLCKRPSHHPAFSDAVSGASRRVMREAGRKQN